jgi:hypothetical protein
MKVLLLTKAPGLSRRPQTTEVVDLPLPDDLLRHRDWRAHLRAALRDYPGIIVAMNHLAVPQQGCTLSVLMQAPAGVR